MSSDPKDLPLTPDGLRARTAAYRESLSAPDTNDMFSLAYQWQDKNHRHVTDLCLVIEEVAKTIEALEAEVAFVKGQLAGTNKNIAGWLQSRDDNLRRAEFAEAQLDEALSGCRETNSRAEAAEARAERLREAITSATANMDHDYAYEILRKAVTEESSVTQPTTEDCSVVRKADVRAVQLRKALETVSGHITNAIICMAAGGTKGRATDILNHASDIARKALEGSE